MYKLAFKTFFENILIILFFAALEVATEHFGFSNGGGTFIVTAILAMFFHQSLLTGQKLGWKPLTYDSGRPIKPHFFTFIWKSIVLLLLPGCLLIALVVYFADTLGGSANGSSNLTWSLFLVAMLPTAILFSLIAAKWGTVLPSAAIGLDASWEAAAKRGKATYWKTLRRLILGPLLFAAILLVVSVFIVALTTNISVSSPLSSIINLALDLLLTALGYSTTLLTATALSMAYLEAEEAQPQPS